MVYILIGVSGSGKTTIGKALSNKLQLPFYDADDFHPESNIKKMASKIPLSDSDRKPWLETLLEKTFEWNRNGDCFLACSCLKKSYRDILDKNKDIKFIYLDLDYLSVEKRLKKRTDHFFPFELIKSQFDILEISKDLIKIDSNRSVEKIVDEVLELIRS